MRFLVLSFLLSTNCFASISEQVLGLMEDQTYFNDQIIHDEAQDEIENDYISDDTLRLIIDTEKLRQNLHEVKESLEKKDCEDPPQDQDPPKKKVTKYKHRTKGQWVIGAVFEVNHDGDYEQYSMLESTLNRADLYNMYKDWVHSESFEDLQSIIKEQTKGMSNNEFLEYMSYMTNALPYNGDKAKFSQQGDTQDTDTLWGMIQEVKKSWEGHEGFNSAAGDEFGGICGDIHFAALMIGEIARPDSYEYFTASYALADAQHVVMFAVDKNTGQAVVVNYDDVQIVDNPDGIESVMVKNSKIQGGFNNVGTNVRIFANSDGNAKHVASVKSALGSFIYNASVDQHKQFGAPIYTDFQTTGAHISQSTDVVSGKIIEKYDKDGNLLTKEKSKSYKITKGFKILKGTRRNGNLSDTDIFTAVYYRNKDVNTDGFGNVIDPKKIGRESSISLSGTHASLGNMFVDENLWVLQLNSNTNLYKTILRTDKVDIQANARLNFNADYYNIQTTSYYSDAIGRGHSADANVETSQGVTGRFKLSENDQINTYVSFDQAIGVQEERQLYDWASLPANVRMTQNALRSGAEYKRRLNDETALTFGGRYIGTQVGGLYSIQTSVIRGKNYVFINYQDNAPGINPNISSNLLPQAGRRLTGGYGAKDLKIGSHMTADFGTQVTYLPDSGGIFMGANFNVNFGSNNSELQKRRLRKKREKEEQKSSKEK